MQAAAAAAAFRAFDQIKGRQDHRRIHRRQRRRAPLTRSPAAQPVLQRGVLKTPQSRPPRQSTWHSCPAPRRRGQDSPESPSHRRRPGPSTPGHVPHRRSARPHAHSAASSATSAMPEPCAEIAGTASQTRPRRGWPDSRRRRRSAAASTDAAGQRCRRARAMVPPRTSRDGHPHQRSPRRRETAAHASWRGSLRTPKS